YFYFFFSSRRRHTRFSRDWSSDVCSSDLVTGVKIDKSFVREIRTATDRAPIIRAVIALAADLDLDVVAEGVETSDQLEFLRAVGCHQAQGYRLGAPVPAETFEQLLLDEVAPQGPLDPSAEPA